MKRLWPIFWLIYGLLLGVRSERQLLGATR
jgi:hypothetical protein